MIEAIITSKHEIIKNRIIDNSIPITDSGCWIWLKSTNNQNYGVIGIGQKLYLAHRISYQIYNGLIQEGMYICHKCDNSLCVNPYHLFLGSNSDNIKDCVNKGRHWQKNKTHCPAGHEYSENITYIDKNSGRYCRICRRETQKRYKWRKNERIKNVML